MRILAALLILIFLSACGGEGDGAGGDWDFDENDGDEQSENQSENQSEPDNQVVPDHCDGPIGADVSHFSDDQEYCAAGPECGAEEEPFWDECGCGCLWADVPACPDPDEPGVEYVGHSPEECADIDFDCGGWQEGFSDECGCGCLAREEPSGQPCDIDDCPDGYYCQYEDGVCGEAGAEGICVAAPEELAENCFEDELATCGCDGQFYQGGAHCYAAIDGGVDAHYDGGSCGG